VTSDVYRELFVSASDGLRLFARDYGPITSSLPSVICLPGLARTSADFHELALALSTDADRPRRVLSLDYRGRGRSEWSDDWQQYDVRVEAGDVQQVLIAAGVDKGIFVGTSRGGLIIMALAVLAPQLLQAAVFNDVGPALEAKGLLRIRGYVGKLPKPRNFAEAGAILRELSSKQFPRWTDENWERLARGTWIEKDDGLALAYDPALMRTLEALDLEQPLPDLWPFFDALAAVPLMTIRGENSDLLSGATLERMRERRPDMTTLVVPGQGHAPELVGEVIASIVDFVNKSEVSRPRTAAA
jgi:pimeloyl-ACP methyl ester carboxylesterase